MGKKAILIGRLFICLISAATAFGRAPEKGFFRDVKIRLGPNLGIISRTVDWKNGARPTNFRSLALTLDSEFSFPHRLTVNVFAGMSFSDLKGATFSNLPFSLEYQAGSTEGFVAGGEIKKGLFSSGDFEIRAAAQFISSMGFKKTWPMEGFAVRGEARGNPNWSQWTMGPEISYAGFTGFTPFMAVSLSWLRGNFHLSEAVAGLRGSETLRIREKDFLRISIGAFADIGRRLRFRGEIVLIPSSGNFNAGASLKFLYAF